MLIIIITKGINDPLDPEGLTLLTHSGVPDHASLPVPWGGHPASSSGGSSSNSSKVNIIIGSGKKSITI